MTGKNLIGGIVDHGETNPKPEYCLQCWSVLVPDKEHNREKCYFDLKYPGLSDAAEKASQEAFGEHSTVSEKFSMERALKSFGAHLIDTVKSMMPPTGHDE